MSIVPKCTVLWPDPLKVLDLMKIWNSLFESFSIWNKRKLYYT